MGAGPQNYDRVADAPQSAWAAFSRIATDKPFRAAAALSALWLLGAAAYGAGFFGLFESATLGPRGVTAIEVALFFLAALAPVTFFAHGALMVTKAEEIRSEAARIAGALIARGETGPATEELAAALASAARGSLAEEMAKLVEAQKRLDAALTSIQTIVERIEGRESVARRAGKTTAGLKALENKEQPALPFGREAAVEGRTGVPWASVVRALNFPTDETDAEGFAALRAALTDKDFAELLQAAEDALTLFSEDGLYMEDLTTNPAPVEIWRAYAGGARGPEVASLAGIEDEVALALVRSRMRSDAVFRDAALHFLRRFDRMMSRMGAEIGEDPMLAETGDTRTGRAFMLIAKIAGVFD